MTTLLYPFVIVSALGLVLSMLAHIGSMLGLNVPQAVFGLHIGIFIVGFPAAFVFKSLAKDHARKDEWRVAMRGAPKWMHYMLYVFLGYAMLTPIIFRFIMPTNPIAEGEPSSTIRGFSAAWIFLYFASFAALYSAIQIQKKGLMRKCLNGHNVPLPAAYCEQCGKPVLELGEPK